LAAGYLSLLLQVTGIRLIYYSKTIPV